MPIQTKKPKDPYAVLIIGAGVSGLSAACALAEQGYSVLVLEAKNCVGGRINGIWADTAVLADMGVWSDTEIWADTEVRPYVTEALQIIENAKNLHWKKWPSLAALLNYDPKYAPALGTAAYIAQQQITHMIKQHTGADPTQVSLLELMNGSKENSPQKIELPLGDFEKLPEMLAQKAIRTGMVDIKLNTPIHTIHSQVHHQEYQVCAKTAQHKEYPGNSILCTVPIGVLKNKEIRFFPELSKEKQKLIQHLGIGAKGQSYCSLNLETGELEHFAMPEPGALFFAGAHTMVGSDRETLKGAYASGLRAAKAIDHYLQLHRIKSLYRPKKN